MATLSLSATALNAASLIGTLLRFAPLIVAQNVGRQHLARIPEPNAVMDGADNVAQYGRALETQLSIAYTIAIETIHRARVDDRADQRAIDLACGTGQFTTMLGPHLGYDQVTGVDLSQPMIDTAKAKLDVSDRRVTFTTGNATDLSQYATNSFDLATFNQAAHHLPDLPMVSRVLAEMDRVTKTDGVVLVTDLARLRTRRITERYVAIIGDDYHRRGLSDRLDDFRNSMFAAWTTRELRRAIPSGTRRHWYHLTPIGLPTMQIILGAPGRRRPYLRRGLPWDHNQCPVPAALREEWLILRATLAMGERRRCRGNMSHLDFAERPA